MRLTIKKVSRINHDGYPNQEVYVMPGTVVGCGPYQERNGEELISLWVPDGTEIYETVTGETALKIPDPSFRDGMRLSLAEAVTMFRRYAHAAD